MPGTRKTLARVDSLLAILELLGTAEGLDKVEISYTELTPLAQKEWIYPGLIDGQMIQPVSGAGRTRNQDEFTIPLHVSAEDVSAQPDGVTAARRCETLLNAVSDTISTVAALPSVPGTVDVVVSGIEGPWPQADVDSGGFVAYGTVHVRVRTRIN